MFTVLGQIQVIIVYHTEVKRIASIQFKDTNYN